MLIGIDASRANRDHKSGTEWYSYYLIRELAKIDSKNQYILYSDQPLRGGLLDLINDGGDGGEFKLDEDGCQILKSPYQNFRGKILHWPFKYFWTLGRLSLEMITRQPDVLFIPAHALPPIHPKKSIVTIHDIGFIDEKILYSKEKIGYQSRVWDWLSLLFTGGKHRATGLDYLDWSTAFSLKHAKKIITISQFSKQEIIKHYQTPAEKLAVVYNGYNRELFKRSVDPKRLAAVMEIYGLEQPYIFYVGRLEKKKNIPALIEAYVLAKQNHGLIHKLYLIGDASFGYDEIKYLVHEFGVEGDVKTTGWIEEAHLPYVFYGADAFVFPTKYEGFGIPLLEAMAAGTPIVASRVAAVPEIAGDAALLFNPNDVRDMSEKIAEIVKNKEMKERLKTEGLKRVAEFSWNKCARETLKIIENL